MRNGDKKQDFLQEIGNWLKQRRLQLGLSLIDIEEISGISNSQISRIERGVSEITLVPAVKLFRVLRVDISEVVQRLGAEDLHIVYRKKSAKKDHLRRHALRIQDAWCTASLYYQMPSRKIFLRELAEWYLQLTGLGMGVNWAPRLKEVPPLERAYVALHGVFEQNPQKPLPYFDSLTMEEITELFMSGSAMLIMDGSAFLRRWRMRQELSLRKIASMAQISTSKYYDLESNHTANLKLSTLLKIQQAIPHEPILPIFWAAASFRVGIDDTAPYDHDPLPWNEETWIMAEALVKISRLAYKAGTDTAAKLMEFIRKEYVSAYHAVQARYGDEAVKGLEICAEVEDVL